MLSAIQIDKFYGERVLLDKVSFVLKPRERAALVGRNGCGKTTLLRIMAGSEDFDGGAVSLTPGWRLGFLGQEGQLNSQRTLYEELSEVFSELLGLEQTMRILEERMAADCATSAEMEEYSRLHEQLHAAEPHLMDAKIRSVATGLGFTNDDLQKLCGHFSGGWQMRGAMARLLLSYPDVLFLDEPTNHLDIEGVEWLEGFLLNYSGSTLVVSHDRAFLDRVVQRTFELSEGELEEYAGNYSYYLEESAQRLEQQLANYKNQQKKLAQDRRFIERFRYKATLATRVKSREKMLDKWDLVDLPRPEKRSIKISFEVSHDSGRDALVAKGISKSYGDKCVLEGVSLRVERGQKVAVVGRNGGGKSTLLRLLAHQEEPDAGRITSGYRLMPVYFAQHQAEALDPLRTPLEELALAAPRGVSETALRTVLGCLLFSGDDTFKRISVLSGGERSRVALARCMVTPSNLMFLDEPTNHLDISSRDVLLESLRDYQGTLILVTHDRYLMDQLATVVWEVEGGTVTAYEGNYSDYRRKKAQLAVVESSERLHSTSRPQQTKRNRPNQRVQTALELQMAPARGGPPKLNLWKLDALEKKIFALEEEISCVSQALADPKTYEDGDIVKGLQGSYEDLQIQCLELTQLWEEMTA